VINRLTEFIRRVAQEHRYLQALPAVVTRDNADGTLDVTTLDGDSLTARKRYVAPGDKSVVSTGIACLVRIDAGGQAWVSEVAYDADSSNEFAPPGKPLARHGDLVSVPVSQSDVLTGVVTVPDPVVASAISGGAATLPVGTPVTLIGVVAVPEPTGAVVGSTVSVYS